MKKLFFLIFIIFISLQPSTGDAQTEQVEELRNEFLTDLKSKELETYWQQMKENYGQFLPGIEHSTFVEFLKSSRKLSLKDLLISLVQYLFKEVFLNMHLLGMLLLLTIFSATLQTLQKAFAEQTISQIAYFVIYISLIYLALN